jgi:hypothetical protein
VSVTSGSSKTFTITPNSGYTVSGVTVDGASAGAVTSYTFNNVTAAHTIAAKFTANTSSTPAGYTYCAAENGTCSFSGTKNVGYGANGKFYYKTAANSVSCNNSVFGDPIPGTVKACYIGPANAYTITASAGTGGSISPSGSVSVTSGSSKTFTIAPGSGYHVSSVNVDGVSVGAVRTYTFSNVAANHTIKASFSR